MMKIFFWMQQDICYWQSEFEKDAPIFQNYQKFRDDWDAILKSYGFVKR